MSRCHSTYSGVAALDSTKTAVTGHAASHTHQVGVRRSDRAGAAGSGGAGAAGRCCASTASADTV